MSSKENPSGVDEPGVPPAAPAVATLSLTDFRSQEGNFAAQFPEPPEDKLLDEEKDVVTTRSAKVAVGEDVVYDAIYGSFAKEQPINEADFETVKNAHYKGLGKCMTVAQGLCLARARRLP